MNKNKVLIGIFAALGTLIVTLPLLSALLLIVASSLMSIQLTNDGRGLLMFLSGAASIIFSIAIFVTVSGTMKNA